ncbi:MAG: HEAT repeat domain-containing protein [Planctomycetes bacterium]|nr:HEAT repeat domain-containing protein [Planctomycetota bacterium]
MGSDARRGRRGCGRGASGRPGVASAILLAGLLGASTARADIIQLKNGARLEGRIVKQDERVLVVEIAGGRMEIRREDVASIKVVAPREAAPNAAPSSRSTRPTSAPTEPDDPSATEQGTEPRLPREFADLLVRAASAPAEERASVVARLAELGSPAPAAVVEALRASGSTPRTLVLLDCLARIGGEKAVAALRSRENDPNKDIAAAAQAGLRTAIAGGTADDPFESYRAGDADERIGLLTAGAGKPTARFVPVLLAALASQDYFPRREALRTLKAWLAAARQPAPPEAGRVGPDGRPVSPAVGTPNPAGAAREAIDALLQAAARAPEAEALGLCATLSQIGEAPIPGLLAGYVRQGPPAVRAAALRGLGECHAASESPTILKALEDSGPLVRTEAAIALGKLRGAGAVTPLIQLLLDPEPAVRAAATRALQQITGMSLPESHEAWEAWARTSGR